MSNKTVSKLKQKYATRNTNVKKNRARLRARSADLPGAKKWAALIRWAASNQFSPERIFAPVRAWACVFEMRSLHLSNWDFPLSFAY